MKKKEYLKEIIRSFHLRGIPPHKPRSLQIPLESGKVVTLCGVRRCGKTYLLYQTMQQLLGSGVEIERILFVNFEDERLELAQEELDWVLQSYRELYAERDLSECYLFFDEIQNVPGWEAFIRRIYDTLTQNIFITGSNAKLLSQEIATSLRGRNITFEVYPLSFKEYLSFVDHKPDLYDPTNQARIKNHFAAFLKQGGFPETLMMSPEIRTQTLQSYFDVMIYRDIIERYEEKNGPLLKYFIKRILGGFTKPLSIHKIYNELKSSGFKVGKNTLYHYFDYLETIYLAFALKRYDPSILKSELAEKKAYFIDNGLLGSITFAYSDDQGKLLENLLFLEFKKSGREIFYYRGKQECDFLLFERDKPCEAIQVCYDLGDTDTKKREVTGLLEACRMLGLKKGVILSFDEEDAMEIEGVHIQIQSAWRYALSLE